MRLPAVTRPFPAEHTMSEQPNRQTHPFMYRECEVQP
jgi:hypothetical protein